MLNPGRDAFVFIPLRRVLEKLREAVEVEGAPCDPATLDLQLSDDLYLSGLKAVLKAENGYKCREIGAVSEAIKTLAYPRIVEQRPLRTLKPPYVELYEDARKYVVLGIYEDAVYMTEWSGIRLCCSWIVDMDVGAYTSAAAVLREFIESS